MTERTILIVDDEARMATVLKAALEPEGYAIATATNGTAAMNALDTHTYDVVLLISKWMGR
jgi:DNA-binding response OmpR family regulator